MRIKELRDEKRLSQKFLAEKIGTSQRNIGRWENGENEPTYTQLIKLADFFNCSIDYLVEREDDFGNVISSADNGAELSSEEKELLRLFDKLNLFEREAMMIQMRALAEKKPINK